MKPVLKVSELIESGRESVRNEMGGEMIPLAELADLQAREVVRTRDGRCMYNLFREGVHDGCLFRPLPEGSFQYWKGVDAATMPLFDEMLRLSGSVSDRALKVRADFEKYGSLDEGKIAALAPKLSAEDVIQSLRGVLCFAQGAQKQAEREGAWTVDYLAEAVAGTVGGYFPGLWDEVHALWNFALRGDDQVPPFVPSGVETSASRRRRFNAVLKRMGLNFGVTSRERPDSCGRPVIELGFTEPQLDAVIFEMEQRLAALELIRDRTDGRVAIA